MAMLVFWVWLYRCVAPREMSGDRWYMRLYAYTNDPVSPPYCWRPLLPYMARVAGFAPVSYLAIALTPLVVYGYVGGGWAGFACAMIFVGNRMVFSFNVSNPEYVEGVGQLLFISSLWALSVNSPWAWPLLLLAALCRETITAALGLIVLFWNPILLIPLAVGAGVSYFTRREHTEAVGRHPLVETTVYETVKRWVKVKGANCLHWAHTIQPIRGLALAVPFVWGGVGDFTRLSLVGCAAIWLLALPASGQSRIMCYSVGILLPFAAALPVWWLWFFVLIAWFWPFDFSVYDESGGQTFGFAR
jgi:hypothetical protein